MKWKPEVILTGRIELQLCMGDRIKQVAPGDVHIAKAMKKGVSDIEQLKELIAKVEGIDEISAAFGLAQFILDYGDFIADDTSHYIIAN